MNIQKEIEKYAELLVVSGINIKKGQELYINAPVHTADFVRLVTKFAFIHGAKDVYVNYLDEEFTRLRYEYADISVFENPSEWAALRLNESARKDFAFLHILSNDPDAYSGIDARKPAAARKAMYAVTKEYNFKLDINACQWCVAGIPCEKWAKKVFPNDSAEKAVEKLWEAILKSARVDTPDPIAAWKEHQKTFLDKKQWLNSLNLSELHYKSSNGTDFTVGLIDGSIFEGGGDATPEGHFFFPNMPTEEIFTSPHLNRAEGRVVNALPLIYNGTVIDNFSITFKDGRITDFTAEKGYDTLKSLIETDEGSHHLGEIALIPNDSPISNMNILFYDTLYDENASCHLAIGRGFPTCIKGGTEMTEAEAEAKGVNNSSTHVDFMIGTADLEIIGKDRNGKEIPIFKNGNWA